MWIFKSQQEKDIERRRQIKQGRRKAERHIQNQRNQVQTYWELARKAYRLSDQDILQRLVTLIQSTRQDLYNWERRLLYFDMIEAQRDQALASVEFAKAFDAMSQTILASANPAELTRIQTNMERSLLVAEDLEDRLQDFQSSLDDLLNKSVQNNQPEMKEILDMIKREVEQEPDERIDTEIGATMQQIEDLLGRKGK